MIENGERRAQMRSMLAEHIGRTITVHEAVEANAYYEWFFG